MLPPPGLPSAFRPLHAQRGFSLVEVVLAIGITSSALLIIFSLMPLGLSTLQDAQRQIVETQIYNKLSAELRSTALYQDPTKTTNTLAAYCQSSRFPAYFDMEGNELPAAVPPPAQAVFTVRCVESTPTSSWTPSPTGELLCGTVRIGYHQDPRTENTAVIRAHQRTFLLSNHGR